MIRSLVNKSDIDDAYKAMAEDKEREQEAHEWINGTFGDVRMNRGDVYWCNKSI